VNILVVSYGVQSKNTCVTLFVTYMKNFQFFEKKMHFSYDLDVFRRLRGGFFEKNLIFDLKKSFFNQVPIQAIVNKNTETDE